MATQRQNIVLKETLNFTITMFKSSKEELEKIQKLIEEKDFSGSNFDYPFLGNIICFGDIKTTNKTNAQELVTAEEPVCRLEPSQYHFSQGVPTITKEYKCYARKGGRHPTNNLIVHEDAISSLYCAAGCINAKYVFITKTKKDATNSNRSTETHPKSPTQQEAEG